MDDQQLARISHQLILKDFGLSEEEVTSPDIPEDLFDNLRRIVQHLLDHDFEKLLNVMYRIDLSEQKVKKVLTTENPKNLSKCISRMILERELQKAKTRIKYSK
ncbi:hypothetical protein [Marinoscillum sp.]|uniref:hypothetical protein n=1 Tax=Marinoscillum sp. TaxID=2024838 RepID=UPI003BAA14DA